MCQIWTDGSHQLRICPITESISLTVKYGTQIDTQSSIQLYREKSREPDTLARVSLRLHTCLHAHVHKFQGKSFICFLSCLVELSKECGKLIVVVCKKEGL